MLFWYFFSDGFYMYNNQNVIIEKNFLFFFHTCLGSSHISRSEMSPLSILNLTAVRLSWNPDKPAAPGFIATQPYFWS